MLTVAPKYVGGPPGGGAASGSYSFTTSASTTVNQPEITAVQQILGTENGPNNAGVTVNWTHTYNSENPTLKYIITIMNITDPNIYIAPVEVDSNEIDSNGVDSNISSTQIMNLISNNSYYFTVTAINEIGVPVVSNNSNNIRLLSVPDIPNITTENITVGDRFIRIRWTQPSEDITSYRIQIRRSATTIHNRLITATDRIAGSLDYDLTFGNLTNGLLHVVSIAAINTAGRSEFMILNVIPATRPEKPIISTAVLNTTNQSVVVSWTAPNSGGSRIRNYTVKTYQNDIEVEDKRVTTQLSTQTVPSPTTATITGIANDGTYTFSVLATNIINNIINNSDESDKVTPIIEVVDNVNEAVDNVTEPFGNISQTRTANSRTNKLPTGVYSSNNMSMYATIRKY